MKNILVTGAGGYIGRHVVSELLDMGYEVTAADIYPPTVDKRAHAITANIFDGNKNIYTALGCPDACIHMAWRDGFVHNSDAHMGDLSAHFQFLKSMIDGGLKQLSVMGSMHEVGYWEGAIDENTPCKPLSQYGIAKNALRQALEQLTAGTDVCLHWLRAYYIYGDDLGNNSIFSKILKQAAEGAERFPFTMGTNQYDFIHINDLALQIALTSVQDEVLGTVNCCTGRPVALKDRVEAFIKEHELTIQLQYGVFADRPYDSRIVYGDNQKIKQVLLAARNSATPAITARIDQLLSAMT